MPTETKSAYARRWRMEAEYGLTSAGYDALLAEQDGQCAICGGVESRLVIDHNHDTGKVRGLLCQKCNRGLGQFDEAPRHLLAAIAYIERHRPTAGELQQPLKRQYRRGPYKPRQPRISQQPIVAAGYPSSGDIRRIQEGWGRRFEGDRQKSA